MGLDAAGRPEWSWFDTPGLSLITDTEVLGAMEALTLECRLSGSHEPARRLLVAVTRELDESTSSSEIVFASDHDLEETPRNVRAALATPRLRELRRRGWLIEDQG